MPFTVPELLRPHLAQPVAIFGGGVGGEGVLALLGALGATGKIYDARGADFTVLAARAHSLVVYSPGFAPEHPWLARAAAVGADCLGELDFAALCWRGQIVAITGTNGKTTLTEFLTHALRSLGRDAHATGHLGHPFSRLAVAQRGGTKDMLALCEVSSFQAETLRHFRADATLWTNFAEDHLERHPGLEAYFSAKWNLVARTTPGGLFAGSSVARYAQKFDRPVPPAALVASEGRPADPRLARTVFAEYPQRENFLLAAAWWRATGLDEAALLTAARSFRLGRHRLARVIEHDGVVFWNDSKATNFHAVEAALAGFTAPVVLIAGGKAKGGDLAGFVHRIAPRVKHAVLMGGTSADLAFHCSTFRVAHTTCATLDEAVRRAAELAAPGEHVLLSPGFASFDQFRNYEDRGEQFEFLARHLAAAAPI
ncbi:MAG: UDP-N-acetylmuramoyl-L-alanine--D-glutamate ligase [Opitutus sp.]|nr:UDP-N-acetylmuramoyl-L-alanine--D-glutamate ligase [Opitutus sp.]